MSGGTSSARKLRRAGKTPAVVYGQGKETVNLCVSSDQLNLALGHGAKLVKFQGGSTDNAIISDVQWDGLGSEVLHVDFTRVSTDERIELSVAVDVRGEAPGTHEGGSVQVMVHELDIECPVISIPEKITVNVNELALDATISAGEVELPEGAKLLTDAATIVVQCVEIVEEVEETAAPSDGAEPEVIGKAEEDEGGGEQ